MCIGTQSDVIAGDPDPKHISTSYVERQNLTMRMHMRRFTRLTNGFSKKLENHIHMVALYTVFYNWTKIHKTTARDARDGGWPERHRSDNARRGGDHRPCDLSPGHSLCLRHYPRDYLRRGGLAALPALGVGGEG